MGNPVPPISPFILTSPALDPASGPLFRRSLIKDTWNVLLQWEDIAPHQNTGAYLKFRCLTSEFSHSHYSANHPFIPVTDDFFLTPAFNLVNSSCLSCFPSPWYFSPELCLETHCVSASFCRTIFFSLSHPGYAQKGFFCKPNGSHRVTYSFSL